MLSGDNTACFGSNCEVNSQQLCILWITFSTNSCSCKILGDLFCIRKYEDYRGEKLVSIVNFFLRVLGFFLLVGVVIIKLSPEFGGKVHFWPEMRLSAGKQMGRLSWWRGGSSRCLLRLVLFNIFIHDLHEVSRSAGTPDLLGAAKGHSDGKEILQDLPKLNGRHNVGKGASVGMNVGRCLQRRIIKTKAL